MLVIHAQTKESEQRQPTARIRVDLPVFGERGTTAGENGCNSHHIRDTDQDKPDPSPHFHVSETNPLGMND